MTNSSTLSTGLLYHNATEMINWLCETFGFEKTLIVPGQDKLIIHAHLTLGKASIMISSKFCGRSSSSLLIWWKFIRLKTSRSQSNGFMP
jgi:uncharacterized glyoxalase superfamily protein PhnB